MNRLKKLIKKTIGEIMSNVVITGSVDETTTAENNVSKKVTSFNDLKISMTVTLDGKKEVKEDMT